MWTIVYIQNDQLKELARLSKADGRSRASLIRDAITAYIEKRMAKKEVRGFGLWKDHPVDGVEYQRKIRSEW
jgi:metal-responsive CopG/Arc/MetJ family transcriptional regulator